MASARTKPSSVRSWILFNSWTPTSCSFSWRPSDGASGVLVGAGRWPQESPWERASRGPGASGDPLLGRSAGRPLDEELSPEPEVDLLLPWDTNKEVDVGYQPPKGFSADEMIDYLSDVTPTRRPSSVVQALSGPVPDRAADYLLQVVAVLQRRIAPAITTAVEDATGPLQALLIRALWTPPRRSSPVGDGAHLTRSDFCY